MRGGQGLGDLGPRAETGVDQPIRLQPVERCLVEVGPLRLHDRLAVDRQPEPGDVLEYAVDELRSAPRGIEILDPQQPLSPARPRLGVAEHRRKSMAEVQAPRRRWGKTCDLQDSLHDKGAHRDS
jgi:hypothetical protein